jgi:ATP-binding cassette, subfamily B, bacterial
MKPFGWKSAFGLSESWRRARAFKSEFQGQRLSLGLVLLLSLLTTLLELLRPWPLQRLFDRALLPFVAGDLNRTSADQLVLQAALLALSIALSLALCGYLRELLLARIGHTFARRLRARSFQHLTEQGPEFHQNQKSGDLLVRLLGDVPLVKQMLVDSSIELATRLTLVLGTLVALLLLDPWLAALALLAGPVVALSARWIAKHLTIAVKKQRRKEGDLADYLHEALAGAEVIQALGGGSEVVRRFKRNNRTSEKAGLKATRLSAALGATIEGQLGLALALTLGFGAWRVLEGQLLPGELLVFVSYVRGLLRPLRSAARQSERLARGTAGAERLLEVLSSTPKVRELPDALPVPARPQSLAFQGVSYRYPDGTIALEGIDLELRRGQLVALVGPNGAGKSTLCLLAARLMDPRVGTIELDEVPLGQYQLEPLRRGVAVLLQQPLLFGASLRDNLLLARPESSEAELWSVLERAGAADLVRALPEGLDSELGSFGKGFSGGETRRLCLARALLNDPGVLLVDEPFAGLDATAVQQTLALLRELAKERIVLVVAHDLPDLSVFDAVVLLGGGRVLARGTHRELLTQAPAYAAVLRSGAAADAGAGRGNAADLGQAAACTTGNAATRMTSSVQRLAPWPVAEDVPGDNL